MHKEKINSFKEYIDIIDFERILGYEIVLYRGQSSKKTLLPSIARKNPEFNTTGREIEVLEEFKRRSDYLIDKTSILTQWDWLVYAQHFGLKTRLLDWTSNPLVGLWFACSNDGEQENSSFVYYLWTDKSKLINTTEESPFSESKTKILRPNLNNQRIVAQSGWFTVHKYSMLENRFIDLEKDEEISNQITEIEIPSNIKPEILEILSRFGVNNESIYRDITGLCLNLNWENSL